LSSRQQRLVKTGGRLIKHDRHYWLLLAESHLARRLFAGILNQITALAATGGIRVLGAHPQVRRVIKSNGETRRKIGHGSAAMS